MSITSSSTFCHGGGAAEASDDSRWRYWRNASTSAGVTAQAITRTDSWLIVVTLTYGLSAEGSVVIHWRCSPLRAGGAAPTRKSIVVSSPSVWPNTSRSVGGEP